MLTEHFSKIEKKLDDFLVQIKPTPAPAPTPTPTPVTPSDGSQNYFVGSQLYVNPNSAVAQFLAAHPNDPNAALLKKIADQPTGIWLNYYWKSLADNQSSVRSTILDTLKLAGTKLVTFVIYGIVDRDAGGQSAGGAPDRASYYAWCGAIDAALKEAGNPKVVLIMEPDALAFAQQKQNYAQYETIKVAIDILTQNPNRSLYLDVSMWNYPSTDAMVGAIKFLKEQDQMKNVRGWALNTSGYNSDAMCQQFGKDLVAKVGGTFIVDTGRNGRGPAPVGQWENVPGMALGAKPLIQFVVGMDANIWAKPPGESDGADNGAPAAGQFFYDRAVEMARNAKW
ncbi:MAG: glycoside hydrolase family 6 protein [Acidobacteriota bacterium]|nr:glycoside hydrolase family 6 protein [Acidobacteriota bacterium]